jgi:hypothetical protein
MKSSRAFSRNLAAVVVSFCLAISFSAAQVIEPQQAGKIAATILLHAGKGIVPVEATPGSPMTLTADDGLPAVYVFSCTRGEYVILSADKRAYPLLGYGLSGYPANDGNDSLCTREWPPALRQLVETRIREIDYLREMDLAPTAETTELWSLLEKGYDPGIAGSKDVAPLLATTWNQGCGYNALCPADPKGPCGKVVTGCVATAMAQVIRYREHPVTGVGSKCYTHSVYGQLCADFSSTVYNYGAMTNSSGNADVALLMYHCGVAVSMNYGPSGSGAFSSAVATAMRNYFDYTNGLIVSKGSYAEDIWAGMLKRELDSNRPVYYSGHGTGGHAFVLDGYEATDHFHVNWGWGGSYNGYFYLTSLNPGSSNFTTGQQAVVGMLPTASFTGPDFMSATDLPCKTPVAGDISSGTDYVNYYGNTYPATLGKELIYRITTTLPGRIRIKITNQSGSVYTFLLNYPHRDSLLLYGTDGLTADDTSPGTYYIIVEGYAGTEPTFTIEAVCPTTDPDLDIRAASVSPQYIESLQPNVAMSSTVRNIGNNSAAASVMEYFLSADTRFDEGVDTFLGSGLIPPLNPGQSATVSSVLTMPDGLLPGDYNVIFVADRINSVPETDDENEYPVYVSVPEPGIINCSSALSLLDGQWHRGNNLTDGVSLIDQYSWSRDMTGPEVIHTFTPLYNGIVDITFVEKSPGILSAMILPICNENTIETLLRIYNLTDTIISSSFYAVAGNQYFLVVDGENGATGDYALKVDLPGECPGIKVEYWGKTDMCDGDPWPGFWTDWGYGSYQWFRDDEAIPGATGSSYTAAAVGDYHVEVSENGCVAASPAVAVRRNMPPDTARIVTAAPLSFCEGGSALLQLENSVLYPLNWALNDTLLPGATGTTITASDQGVWSLYTINGVCRVRSSNTLAVSLLKAPAGIGEALPFPSDTMEFYYPFTNGNNDESGNKFTINGWDYEPADDRFGNFWQARYLRGESQMLYSGNYRQIPEDFTLSLWFRTETDSGGMMAAFTDNPWGPEKTDALLYMSDDGRLHFWISNGTTPVELTSSGSYNDGLWHQVTLQHSAAMTMNINEGTEKIVSAVPAVKQSYSGYWTFGGPDIPAGVSAMPSKKFFNGTIDDLLCLNEVNALADPWINGKPVLSVIGPDQGTLCYPGIITFELPYSQKNIEYRVWNETLTQWAPVVAIGTGGSLSVGGADALIGINRFRIAARNPATGCETISDTLLAYDVPVCTLLPEEHDHSGLRIYPVPASENLFFESEDIMNEIRLFDGTGRLVLVSRPESRYAQVNVTALPAGIYGYMVTSAGKPARTGRVIISGSPSGPSARY